MEQLVALRKRRDGSDSHRHAGRRKEPREFDEAKKSKTAPLKNKGCGTLRGLRATISVSGDSSKPLSHPPAQVHRRPESFWCCHAGDTVSGATERFAKIQNHPRSGENGEFI